MKKWARSHATGVLVRRGGQDRETGRGRTECGPREKTAIHKPSRGPALLTP